MKETGYCDICPFIGKYEYANRTKEQIIELANECSSDLFKIGLTVPHPCLKVDDELRPAEEGEVSCYGHKKWLENRAKKKI